MFRLTAPSLLGFFAASLLSAMPAAAATSDEMLVDAVRSDNPSAASRLMTEGAGVNVRDQEGATALAWAAVRNNVPVAEMLLKAGADPNLMNDSGIGPLYLSIANGSPAMSALLLKKGADPNLAREDGETPLMLAARLGQTEVAKMLLDRGAKPNVRTTKFGQTALMWGAGHPEIVRLLLEHGADA